MDDWRIVITAIVALTALEITALCVGVNGSLFTTVIIVIAGLAGWSVPARKRKK